MAIDNGGPAFPQALSADAMGGLNISYNQPDGAGMTLRDYFAAKALALGGEWFHRVGTDSPTDIADTAYELADAMLKARGK